MELCSICQGINVQSLTQSSRYQHLKLGKLRRSRETCRMCDLLWKTFEESWGPSDITEESYAIRSLDMHLTEGPRPQLRLTDGTFTIEDLTVHTDEGDPALLMGLRPRLSLPSSTRSPESFATARKWMRDCLSGHPRVEGSGQRGIYQLESRCPDSKDKPRRMVHVQLQGSSLLLRLTDAPPDAQAYATLSHCWGAGPWTWITSKANLHQRKAGFCEADLPPTIRDACFAALNLNISYIWVDCLCIVQDDADEWALEAPKMGSIYNGSIVTISATWAASGHDGLFNIKSSPVLHRDPRREITLKSLISCGSSSVLHITRPDVSRGDIMAWTDYVVKAPLMQRAWVCQERVSSHRIIHYTTAQLFWECEHCTVSEDNAIVLSPQGFSTNAGSRQLFLSLYRSTLSRAWDLAPMAAPWWHPLYLWYSDFIGDRYSHCSFTFKRDKLIAISGLAKLIHDRTSIPYYAGHWFPNDFWFLGSLCWQRDSAGAKTREYRAPSWSWASQDSAVLFLGVGNNAATHHSRFLHISVQPTVTFGSLSAGEIVLEGPLLPLELKYIPYTNAWNAHNKTDASDLGTEFCCLDDDTEPSSDLFPYALVMTTYKDVYRDSSRDVYFLILEEIQPAETLTMKRIGFGFTNTKCEWARELLDAPMARVKII